MKHFLSPDLLDSFVERTIEALPSGIPLTSPDCESLAKAWKERGLRPGDLVLLCLPNSRELLHQFFGVLIAQGVPALLPPIVPAARRSAMAGYKDRMKEFAHSALDPVVNGLAAAGLRPNHMTVLGLVFSLAAAYGFALGKFTAGERPSTTSSTTLPNKTRSARPQCPENRRGARGFLSAPLLADGLPNQAPLHPANVNWNSRL